MIEADVLLDDEQRKLSQVVRDFADSVVAPAAYRYDTERRLPMEIIAQMGSWGCSGCRSRATSGPGPGLRVAVPRGRGARARRPVDRGDARGGVGLGIVPLYRHGSREQQERWLPDLLAGRALAAFGLTEAGAGSDAGGTRDRPRASRATSG